MPPSGMLRRLLQVTHSSETSILTIAMRRNIPENGIF
jgi:hypothetical protein